MNRVPFGVAHWTNDTQIRHIMTTNKQQNEWYSASKSDDKKKEVAAVTNRPSRIARPTCDREHNKGEQWTNDWLIATTTPATATATATAQASREQKRRGGYFDLPTAESPSRMIFTSASTLISSCDTYHTRNISNTASITASKQAKLSFSRVVCAAAAAYTHTPLWWLVPFQS